jgi:hypothetical protein
MAVWVGKKYKLDRVSFDGIWCIFNDLFYEN